MPTFSLNRKALRGVAATAAVASLAASLAACGETATPPPARGPTRPEP